VKTVEWAHLAVGLAALLRASTALLATLDLLTASSPLPGVHIEAPPVEAAV
jgi:hypothetical protein